MHLVDLVFLYLFQVLRDPRFDDLSGEYKEEYFDRNYSFLQDVKAKEKEVRFLIITLCIVKVNQADDKMCHFYLIFPEKRA